MGGGTCRAPIFIISYCVTEQYFAAAARRRFGRKLEGV
jgi:hypothetical protein